VVAHFDGRVDRVAVAAPDACPLDVSGLDQVCNDSLRSPFGDADRLGDVQQAHVRVAGQTEQHLRVAGDERPRLVVA
jgi:hypothetical protein